MFRVGIRVLGLLKGQTLSVGGGVLVGLTRLSDL